MLTLLPFWLISSVSTVREVSVPATITVSAGFMFVPFNSNKFCFTTEHTYAWFPNNYALYFVDAGYVNVSGGSSFTLEYDIIKQVPDCTETKIFINPPNKHELDTRTNCTDLKQYKESKHCYYYTWKNSNTYTIQYLNYLLETKLYFYHATTSPYNYESISLGRKTRTFNRGTAIVLLSSKDQKEELYLTYNLTASSSTNYGYEITSIDTFKIPKETPPPSWKTRTPTATSKKSSSKTTVIGSSVGSAVVVILLLLCCCKFCAGSSTETSDEVVVVGVVVK